MINIMASWTTLDDLEGASTRSNFIDSSGKKNTKRFTYRQKFGIHFRYRHQVEEHNNRIHATIYLERKRDTKFWPDRNVS